MSTFGGPRMDSSTSPNLDSIRSCPSNSLSLMSFVVPIMVLKKTPDTKRLTPINVISSNRPDTP